MLSISFFFSHNCNWYSFATESRIHQKYRTNNYQGIQGKTDELVTPCPQWSRVAIKLSGNSLIVLPYGLERMTNRSGYDTKIHVYEKGDVAHCRLRHVVIYLTYMYHAVRLHNELHKQRVRNRSWLPFSVTYCALNRYSESQRAANKPRINKPPFKEAKSFAGLTMETEYVIPWS